MVYETVFRQLAPMDPLLVSIRPLPQRLLDPTGSGHAPGLWPQFVPGGIYLAEGADWTGRRPAYGVVDVREPSARIFRARGEEAGAAGTGRVVRVNLFRREAGWRWTDAPEGLDDLDVLVSVETGGEHHYCLRCEFEGGLTLSRFSEKRTEPRLRPTARGTVRLGLEAGWVAIRGRPRPVWDVIVVEGGPV